MSTLADHHPGTTMTDFFIACCVMVAEQKEGIEDGTKIVLTKMKISNTSSSLKMDKILSSKAGEIAPTEKIFKKRMTRITIRTDERSGFTNLPPNVYKGLERNLMLTQHTDRPLHPTIVPPTLHRKEINISSTKTYREGMITSFPNQYSDRGTTLSPTVLKDSQTKLPPETFRVGIKIKSPDISRLGTTTSHPAVSRDRGTTLSPKVYTTTLSSNRLSPDEEIYQDEETTLSSVIYRDRGTTLPPDVLEDLETTVGLTHGKRKHRGAIMSLAADRFRSITVSPRIYRTIPTTLIPDNYNNRMKNVTLTTIIRRKEKTIIPLVSKSKITLPSTAVYVNNVTTFSPKVYSIITKSPTFYKVGLAPVIPAVYKAGITTYPPFYRKKRSSPRDDKATKNLLLQLLQLLKHTSDLPTALTTARSASYRAGGRNLFSKHTSGLPTALRTVISTSYEPSFENLFKNVFVKKTKQRKFQNKSRFQRKKGTTTTTTLGKSRFHSTRKPKRISLNHRANHQASKRFTEKSQNETSFNRRAFWNRRRYNRYQKKRRDEGIAGGYQKKKRLEDLFGDSMMTQPRYGTTKNKRKRKKGTKLRDTRTRRGGQPREPQFTLKVRKVLRTGNAPFSLHTKRPVFDPVVSYHSESDLEKLRMKEIYDYDFEEEGHPKIKEAYDMEDALDEHPSMTLPTDFYSEEHQRLRNGSLGSTLEEYYFRSVLESLLNVRSEFRHNYKPRNGTNSTTSESDDSLSTVSHID